MDLKPEKFFEIELKALLDKEKHSQLEQLLNSDSRFRLLNKESIRTVFFKDNQRNDIRLRHSDKTCELVYKKGLVREYCRKEIKIPLASKEKLEFLNEIFRELPMNLERGTHKHKQEFSYTYNGYDYVVCLQHLEDFAYILEVEFLAEREEESEIHIPNIKEILSELDLEVIDGEAFMNRVYDYVSGINTIDY